MALQRDTTYTGRFDAATTGQPQGAFKNRTSASSKDGSYIEKGWLNDFSAMFSSILGKSGIVANNVVDAVGASQYFDGLERMRIGQPLYNTWNGFFRRSQASINSPAGFPATGGTVYSIDNEFTQGWFSGANSNNIAITDTAGLTFNQPIYTTINLDASTDIVLTDVSLHVVGQDGSVNWYKTGDLSGAVTITISSGVLRVTISETILGNLTSFTSIKSMFVQVEVGLISEIDNETVSSIISTDVIGSPIPWPLAAAPPGYLIMMGQSFNTSIFTRLAVTYPSGILPDMRGEFIRGWDNARGVNTGRVLLSAESGEIQSHSHTGSLSNRAIGGDPVLPSGPPTNSAATYTYTTNTTGGSETRPRNVAFNYITRAE